MIYSESTYIREGFLKNTEKIWRPLCKTQPMLALNQYKLCSSILKAQIVHNNIAGF